MKRTIFLFLIPLYIFSSESNILEKKSIKDLQVCYDNGNQDCGLLLAKELRRDIKTEEKAMNILLQLTFSGHKTAPTKLGTAYIYSKSNRQDCKKGRTFLFLASKTDPEAIKELALLFKRGICAPKSKKLYKKYIKLYFSEKKKNNLGKNETKFKSKIDLNQK